MPTLKEYNVKLTRLRSTRKLTKTMKLVSVNKLRRAQETERRVAAFTSRIQTMVHHLMAERDTMEDNPLIKPRPAHNILLLVITSDRGLCGGFNNTLLRETAKWIALKQRSHSTVHISCCGRKAHAFLKNRFTVDRFYEHAASHPDFAIARQIGHELLSGFLSGRLDEVHVAWNQTTANASSPSIERFIPLDPALITAGKNSPSAAWMVEPDRAALLNATLPNLVNLRLYQALTSSATGEHGARMRAMDQATSNADTLIRNLTLQRNRARQAQITTELTEIVAGAEALR
jgi:F-type H+-transporting ATPase subunit gamma